MELLSRQKLNAFLSLIGKFRMFKGKPESLTAPLPPEIDAPVIPPIEAKPASTPLMSNVAAYFGEVKWVPTPVAEPISPISSLSPSLDLSPLSELPIPLAVRGAPVTGTVNAFFSSITWSGSAIASIEPIGSPPEVVPAEKLLTYGLLGGVQDYFAKVSWTGDAGAAEKSAVATLEPPQPQEDQASEDFFSDISWD